MSNVAAAPVPSSRDGKIRWWDILIVFVGGNIVGSLLVVLLGFASILFIKHYGYFPISLANPSKSFPIIIAATTVNDVGVLGVLWLVARRRFRPFFSHYFTPIPVKTVGLAALTGLVLSAAIAGMDELISRSGFVKFKASDFELATIPHGPWQFLAALVAVVLLAPLMEEMLFRGLILDWLRRIGGSWVACLSSAVLFSLAHFEFLFHQGPQAWIYSANIFFVGIVMAVWVLRTNSLWASYALHSAYNTVAILVSSLLSWHS